MTARDLIKLLETCDLDKKLALVVSVISEDSSSMNLLLREVSNIVEQPELIVIQ